MSRQPTTAAPGASMKNSIASLWREWQLFYYRAARSQMNPLHPDLPEVIGRISDLEGVR